MTIRAFRHLPVTSLTDVTHNFEQLQSEPIATEGEQGEGKGPGKALIGPVLAFAAHSASEQLGAAAAFAKVKLNTSDFDTAAVKSFEKANNRFVPQTEGYYQCTGLVGSWSEGLPDGGVVRLQIRKNGAEVTPVPTGQTTNSAASTFGGLESLVTSIVFLNGTTDYIELWGLAETSGSVQIVAKMTGVLQGHLIQVGQKGTQGAKGLLGNTGAEGKEGKTGATGATGAEGKEGKEGKTGAEGGTNLPRIEVTTSETLKAAWAGHMLVCNSLAAIVLTVPKEGFVAGNTLEAYRKGEGAVSFKEEAGAVVQTSSSLEARARRSIIGLWWESATESVATGDLK